MKLTCEPLSTLLAHHKMRAITYLSLDVEGGELDALRGVGCGVEIKSELVYTLLLGLRRLDGVDFHTG